MYLQMRYARFHLITWVLLLALCPAVQAQTITGYDKQGQLGQYDETGNRNANFNPHNNDTTRKNKIVPKGLHVWTVDRKLGDITPALVDTLPHLYPQSTLAKGRYGQYNTTGTNYSPRLSRIFVDRPENEQFLFEQPYDQTFVLPNQWHFTNTLSPITNLSYDNCGDKTDGEDHVNGRFAVNAGKRIGLGFDLDYAYARGYYLNQSTSHFNTAVYGSYLGDRYQLHALVQTQHHKASENGGVTNDDYITHPELFSETYNDNEIPTALQRNWNRNNSLRLFLTHRYSMGFFRQVKMTDDEIAARKFAQQSQKDNDNKKEKKTGHNTQKEENKPMGRPEGAMIAGMEPQAPGDSLAAITEDSTRIRVQSKAQADSLLAQAAKTDSLAELMKQEFVPVTSFIHTMEMGNYEHIYQAYDTPANYYAQNYYKVGANGYTGDSCYDQTKHFLLKNTLGLALLEGFNKWAQAGIKAFVTHELRRFDLPELSNDGTTARLGRWTEHNVSIGGRLSKTRGRTLHYLLTAETWLAGEDAGQLKADFQTDLNFALLGDTVRLAAKAYFHRLKPTFYERHYHSKHLWWDNDDLNQTTRTKVEGNFTYEKTRTKLRVAIEEIQNYTYFGMSYDLKDEKYTKLTASLNQNKSNLHVFTAQLDQQLQLGPLHWDNVLTYQTTSDKDVLPLPTLNVFSNLYLKFTIAHVLQVELGGSATYFTKYYMPNYLPQLGQFAVQQNSNSRVELGNFPIIDVYANLHLKHARFFIMMNNIGANAFNRQGFLTPHYPLNRSVMHLGVSWNFFN